MLFLYRTTEGLTVKQCGPEEQLHMYNYPVEACGLVMKVFFSCCVNRSLLKNHICSINQDRIGQM